MIMNNMSRSVRREARRQRRVLWMLSRCGMTLATDMDIIPEEMAVVQVQQTEPEKCVEIVDFIPAVEIATSVPSMIEKETEELRKMLILHSTIKKMSSKKK